MDEFRIENATRKCCQFFKIYLKNQVDDCCAKTKRRTKIVAVAPSYKALKVTLKI